MNADAPTICPNLMATIPAGYAVTVDRTGSLPFSAWKMNDAGTAWDLMGRFETQEGAADAIAMKAGEDASASRKRRMADPRLA